MSTSNGRLRAIVAALIVWLVSVPAAELVFRLLGDRTTTDLAGLFEPFGNGSYRLRRGVFGNTDTLQGRYAIATNALGLRCGAAQRNASPLSRPVDILVLGDSQAFGDGLNFEDSLVGQMAAMADHAGLHVENAAVVGHYLTNQAELMRWLDAQGLRPRQILLMLSPYLIATAGQYNRVHVGDDGRLYGKDQGPRVTSWLKMHTVIYGRVRNAVNQLHPLGKDELTPLAVKIYSKGDAARYTENTRRALQDLEVWAGDHGATLAVVYIPMAVEVAFDPVLQAAKGKAVEVNVPYSAARSAADSLGIPLYDLRATLAALAGQKSALTLPADAHYNARTSAACASDLWKALSRREAALSAAAHPGALE